MKRRYSYLRVLLIMIFFSMSSASCAGRSDNAVKEDFAFIMKSLRASKYQEALQGNDERWGIQKFGEEDPIFKMKYVGENTMLHAVIQAKEDVQGTTTRNAVIDEILKRCPSLLNAQDTFGQTPLIEAVIDNKEEAIECLLTKDGLDLTIKDSWNSNALSWAISQNRPVALIKSILDRNPDLLNERVGKGKQIGSLLHEAINIQIRDNQPIYPQGQNKTAIIVELIKRKPALLQEKDGQGRTPLEYAKELKSKGELIDETLITTLETAEKELPLQPQFLDTTRTANDTNAPWYYNKAIIGLIGIPVILGIAYRIKKMFDAKNKPVSEHIKDKTIKAPHADW